MIPGTKYSPKLVMGLTTAKVGPAIISASILPSAQIRPCDNFRLNLTVSIIDVYTNDMRIDGCRQQPADALFELPCACQNLRRLTRLITRIYDQELRKAGLEITQFGLLTALAATGEANQKRLSEGFAMDSTTLTRTLALLRKQGWVRVKRGKDRRERVFSLTQAGKRRIAEAQPYWELAERKLRQELGDVGWKQMEETIWRATEAAIVA